MRQLCEVCENFRPDAEFNPKRVIVEVTYEARTVTLCRGHARIAENSGVKTFEELRDLYGSGRRSYVPRRAPFVVGEGSDRRSNFGRRATDLPRQSDSDGAQRGASPQ